VFEELRHIRLSFVDVTVKYRGTYARETFVTDSNDWRTTPTRP
jgi:hypothetical protein